MFSNPETLLRLCIDTVVEHLPEITRTITTQDTNTSKLVFNYPDVFFPVNISELLLCRMCDMGKLTDLNMSLFDAKTTRLSRVSLRNVNLLTRKGLRVLRDHYITELEATGLTGVTVNDLVLCLNDWSLQHLKLLNVARCSFFELDTSRYCVVVALSKLTSLQYLNVSNTEFSTHGLEIVCEDLPKLEALDISNTLVDDLTPLRKCKDRLKSLFLYNLKISNESVIQVLLDLKELRVLDISDNKDIHPFELFAPVKLPIKQLLHAHDKLEHLTFLDISGKEEVNLKDIEIFLQYHQDMVFLGLLYSENCDANVFVDPKHRNYNPKLVVTGTATEEQILESLRRYVNRPNYVQKTLYNLFRLTPSYFNSPRIDIIKLVLNGMRLHRKQLGVQMAATACLYNLTKGELAGKIHPDVLSEVIDLTMVAMEGYPNHYQTQKNTLLTLCSDRILQDVKFDKYKCTRLVLSCLCNFDDPSMNRMSVAICSILAGKISTNETNLLGTQPIFMKKLLDIVQSKLETKTMDITLKFTLSALWNLTDESPSTCRMFIKEGGMDLFLLVLQAFNGESTIESKILGLVNNIAEVLELRQDLMIDDFLLILRALLVHSRHIEVSYFAAGIFSHLASMGPSWWTVTSVDYNSMLNDLAKVVLDWGVPECEMVAYRTFYPFFPLLKTHVPYQVQLWAVWAIHHVCHKNGKKYCPMLLEEGGRQIIETLSLETETHPSVRSLAINIIEELK